MPRQPRVFVVERTKPHVDVTKAAEYGELTYVFPDATHASVFDTTAYVAAATERLRDYDPAIDYFCVAGSLLPVSVVLSILATWHKTINILLFNAMENKYASRTLDLRRVVSSAMVA